LADKNNIPFIFLRFSGVDKAAIFERNDYGYRCILLVYEKIKARLSAENICISDTTVRPRKDRYLFDYDAVNEAILNALVHRLCKAFHNRCYVKSIVMQSRFRIPHKIKESRTFWVV
jgi:hypothetical protein